MKAAVDLTIIKTEKVDIELFPSPGNQQENKRTQLEHCQGKLRLDIRKKFFAERVLSGSRFEFGSKGCNMKGLFAFELDDSAFKQPSLEQPGPYGSYRVTWSSTAGVTFHQPRLLQALSNLALDTSKDGAATASLGNLCQGLPTLITKNSFLKYMECADVPLLTPSSKEMMSQALKATFSGFAKEQQRLGIPKDPQQWTETHVRDWVMWAVNEFSLKEVDFQKFCMNGAALCALGKECFLELAPDFVGDILWEHLEILQKEEVKPFPVNGGSATYPESRYTSDYFVSSGPIQLWQFLLELLTDKSCQSFISWTGDGWEFKLSDPDEPKMNYEKLSRGLRYYYDKNIIHKTAGKRYVYRFVCDLQSLLGYSPEELHAMLDVKPDADE
ncbi:hypothetical protein WISP_02344 [Willisornis vidua]|uniref:Protein C-ets-1 n=1 Tax=Willisornis vidua TaxID=1566151 RepID=A0ABQ9DZL4_9PASS|nr:hypothetical protein WISP_02344 [Willisornis vidua]